ncbi:MAG: DegT/DnrJ/EryC1/StrS family aminotransferase [Fimbriimonadaceae bacterium]
MRLTLPVRVPFYNIKAQYDELQPELDAAVLEVLAGGTYTISGGTVCRNLERDLCNLLDVKHAISVNSGADALRIMLDAAGIGRGDEVITTAFTFVASVEAIVQAGATPVFVDIDARTFNIDPAAVQAAVTPRTKAIMPIHLFGQIADTEALGAIAAKHGLVVLEDAAQAVGSTRHDKAPGAFGLSAGFSFYVTKNLGAAGDAGLIVTNDDAVAERCLAMRVHGMGRERYYYDYLGYTSRMDEIQAAVLRVKLGRLSAWNAHRARVAAAYSRVLAETSLKLPVVEPGNVHAWHQYTVRTPRRDALQAHLKDVGVDSAIFYPVPIHFHAPYRRFGGGEGSLPVSEACAQDVLSLPIHQHLPLEHAEFVAEQVVAFAGALAATP